MLWPSREATGTDFFGRELSGYCRHIAAGGLLADRVLSCGLDEVPGVYKDIRKVMEQQTDLVDVVARFDPKLVKMSDDGKSED